jgi:hypothetical protein
MDLGSLAVAGVMSVGTIASSYLISRGKADQLALAATIDRCREMETRLELCERTCAECKEDNLRYLERIVELTTTRLRGNGS